MQLLTMLEDFIVAFSPVNVLLFLLGILLLLSLLILVFQLKGNTQIKGLTFPVYDYIIKEAKHKAEGIIQTAKEKRDEMLSAVEHEAEEARKRTQAELHDYIEKEKQASNGIQEAYEKRIAELGQKHEELLGQYGGKLEEQYAQMTKAAGEQAQKSEQAVGTMLTELAGKLEVSQKELHKQLSEEMTSHLSKSFESVERSIESYRRERLTLIDTKIVSLVEHATALTLQKELSLKEHSAFIYQALEEAKKQGLFS